MASVIVYMVRRIAVNVNEEMSDDDIRYRIKENLFLELGLTDEDVAIDGYEIEEE